MKKYELLKVAVFTGNRAEYGLLTPIIEALKGHDSFSCSLVISGAHLEPQFGSTVDDISSEGFACVEKVKLPSVDCRREAIPYAIGTGVAELAQVFSNLNPDFVMVYADRFEGFAAAIAASQMNIPVIHVEGGDLTEGGALDDSVRHAISKLSHVHLVTNSDAALRLRCMGEESWRVKNIGLPSVDAMVSGRYATPREVSGQLNLDFNKPIIIFTQHSVTTEFEHAADQIRPSLESLKYFLTCGVQVIITYPNNDAGSTQLIQEIERLDDSEFSSLRICKSLGHYLYYGILALAKLHEIQIACVGNSSSGIKETPSFGCPSVNIGSRQRGRLVAENVINVDYDCDEISQAIKTCLFSSEFREKCRGIKNPYGDGRSGSLAVEFLLELPTDKKVLLQKKWISIDLGNLKND